jgi:hypothetical protein
MTNMVSECMDYDSNYKRIFEMNFNGFQLINQKCALDYSFDQTFRFVRLSTTNYNISFLDL